MNEIETDTCKVYLSVGAREREIYSWVGGGHKSSYQTTDYSPQIRPAYYRYIIEELDFLAYYSLISYLSFIEKAHYMCISRHSFVLGKE